MVVYCRDREGIVPAITSFISKNKGDILCLEQRVDSEKSRFFMRVEWDLARLSRDDEQIGEEFRKHTAAGFEMLWQLYFSNETPRMALFCIKAAALLLRYPRAL